MSSNGRVAGCRCFKGSGGSEHMRLVHDSQFLVTLTVSLSMFGQYTEVRARWRVLVTP